MPCASHSWLNRGLSIECLCPYSSQYRSAMRSQSVIRSARVSSGDFVACATSCRTLRQRRPHVPRLHPRCEPRVSRFEDEVAVGQSSRIGIRPAEMCVWRRHASGVTGSDEAPLVVQRCQPVDRFARDSCADIVPNCGETKYLLAGRYDHVDRVPVCDVAERACAVRSRHAWRGESVLAGDCA